ncbi:3-phytase [Xylariaceae sp. FL0016]|nr:3-phytase [Xylariaceae sp. FL0016]
MAFGSWARFAICANVVATAVAVDLPISARTANIESDTTAVIYNETLPILVGNDGDAATGGFRTFDLNSEDPLMETSHQTPGRTKLLTSVYGVGERDLIVTIAQPDSYFRLYDASTSEEVGEPISRTLGDWSALCGWRSQDSSNQFLFLFGKHEAVQYLLRQQNGSYELLEIQTFETPVEASSCAVSESAKAVYFSGDDDATIYTLEAAEATTAPEITTLGQATDEVTGLTVYRGNNSDYLIVAQGDTVAVYDTSFLLLGNMTITGDEKIELEGLAVYQGATKSYPNGSLTFAVDSDAGKAFGVSSLGTSFSELGLGLNTAYDPRQVVSEPAVTVCTECGFSGFCGNNANSTTCDCFAGFSGESCASFTCRNDCSGHGDCTGANQCSCEIGWGGLYCAFKVVEPVFETDAYGGDGDDPAIWVSPINKSLSRIVTTTKSEEGSGLSVFDLTGKKIQSITAGEPDNVDIIYNFPVGNRTIDLAYAACRTDGTLCLFEMTSNGTLVPISGGSQPTKEDFTTYGSCVYRSQITGKQYLFVNAKSAEYLQFELMWEDGALNTTLVRNFTGGSGGQVEGCVGDDANGWVFVSEEPYGLWRYGAEPDDNTDGYLIDNVEDGRMYADVEGVTLVEGATADKGFVIVSQQGVSAYNVYRRAAPHDFVETFTIYANNDDGIDAVTNTDGLAAVGTGMGSFSKGLVVVHDDANQLPDGSTSEDASFKLVSLADVLSDSLLAELDPEWDPRTSLR